jgi:ribosomal protein S6--L-glutamate ligase
MKILILSSDSSTAASKSLVECFSKSQHETDVLNPLEIHFEFGRNRTSFFHLGAERKLPQIVLLRLGWKSLAYGLRIGRFFESAGCRVVNSPDSVAKASDKLTSLQIFQKEGLAIPQTRFAHPTLKSEWHLAPNQEKYVFKTLKGSQGFGVTWQKSQAQAQAQVDAYRTLRATFLTQELVTESEGQDIRAFVIDGQVVASMKRQGPAGDLRSNLHQGGKATKIEISPAEKELALKACKSLGLYYAGVDFMRSTQGPLLLEANPSPGFEGINQACEINVAQKLMERLLAIVVD